MKAVEKSSNFVEQTLLFHTSFNVYVINSRFVPFAFQDLVK